MAKRIHIDVPGVRINESDRRVLSCVASCAREATHLACEAVPIPYRRFMDDIALCETSVIRICRRLRENGLMTVELNEDANGGRLANSYALTALGIEVLRLADDAVAAGRLGTR